MQLVASARSINLKEELDYYLARISSSFKTLPNDNELINLLEEMFNVTVTLEQLEEYYSPNASEIEEDLRLQFKHLGYA